MAIGSPHRSPSNWMGFSCNTNLDKECASALTICIMQTHRRRWLFLLLLLSAWKSLKTGVLMLCILQVANLSLSLPLRLLMAIVVVLILGYFRSPKKATARREKSFYEFNKYHLCLFFVCFTFFNRLYWFSWVSEWVVCVFIICLDQQQQYKHRGGHRLH